MGVHTFLFDILRLFYRMYHPNKSSLLVGNALDDFAHLEFSRFQITRVIVINIVATETWKLVYWNKVNNVIKVEVAWHIRCKFHNIVILFSVRDINSFLWGSYTSRYTKHRGLFSCTVHGGPSENHLRQ
jgi:hypothetical protein